MRTTNKTVNQKSSRESNLNQSNNWMLLYKTASYYPTSFQVHTNFTRLQFKKMSPLPLMLHSLLLYLSYYHGRNLCDFAIFHSFSSSQSPSFKNTSFQSWKKTRKNHIKIVSSSFQSLGNRKQQEREFVAIRSCYWTQLQIFACWSSENVFQEEGCCEIRGIGKWFNLNRSSKHGNSIEKLLIMARLNSWNFLLYGWMRWNSN